MRAAIDFSFARPSVQDLISHELDVLCYTGSARPDAGYFADLRAAGIAVTLVQESDPNRSQQGHGAGVEDARFADSRADEVGYPRSASIAYVVSDGSAGDPSSGGDQISEYARGVVETSVRPVFWYGNVYATDAAMSGAPNSLGTWIPSSWGTGSLLTQEANIASPIGDTDLNTVHAPYGAWGHDTPTPANPFLEYQMDEFFATDPADRRNIWWFSGAGRRHVSAGEWSAITTQAAFRQLPAPKPFAGTPEMFSAPDVTSFAGGVAGGSSFTVTSTVKAA